MTAYPGADPARAAFLTWRRCCAAAGWHPAPRVEQVPVTAAVGRVSAAPVLARRSSPAYELAAMDGIAVRAADLDGASHSAPVRLAPGAFEVVDTGDPLPPGRDAVVMREHLTRLPGGCVELLAPVRPGRHVRGVGEDVLAGELLLPAGHRLRPIDAAVVAGAGHADLPVRRLPRVAVLPTGDEVRPIGTEIGRGEVLDTNSLMLAEMVREAGCMPIGLPIVPDDRGALAAAIAGIADEVELVLVIAGSSAGRDDHTAAVLAGLGEVAVHGVAMRPGHPVVLGVVHGRSPVPAVGVPGYPVSAAHVFDTFVRPFLQAIETATPVSHRPSVPAVLARAVTSPAGLDECLAVRLDDRSGTLVALPVGRGAGALSALMRADGLLRIPAGCAGLDAGAEVLVERLPGAPARPDHSEGALPAALPAPSGPCCVARDGAVAAS